MVFIDIDDLTYISSPKPISVLSSGDYYINSDFGELLNNFILSISGFDTFLLIDWVGADRSLLNWMSVSDSWKSSIKPHTLEFMPSIII